MALCRRLYRLTLVAGWFGVIFLPAFLVQFGGWGGVRRVGFFTRLWARGLLRILNVQLTVVGDPDLFHGGLIVSNHTSYLDALTHGALFRIRFAPKVEIRRWPLLGWYIALSRPVWVDRRNKLKTKETMDAFAETLRRNISMLVYPEGTTSGGEEGILPFKSTPFEAACQIRTEIQPLITLYRRGADGRSPAWYGDDAMLPHVWWLLGQKATYGTVLVLPIQPACEGEDRKTLAARVREVMLREYEKYKLQ